jgi:hypothetical protein
VVAHEAIDHPQVAATVPGIGVIGRERVEQLGLKRADRADFFGRLII